MEKKSGLGRGLDVLFNKNNVDLNSISESSANLESVKTFEVNIEKINVNPYQPREDFDMEKLNELAESIKINGIIQPLTVKKAINSDRYDLISGERRLRAAKLAGLVNVPVYIYEKPADTSEKMLELALIENIQRADLNPMELSNSYQRLVDECGLTQEQIADKVSKQRSTVANFLRLQKLPNEIKISLRKNEITEAHARMLLRIDNIEDQLILWKRIIDENITVKNLELITKPYSKQKKKSTSIEKEHNQDPFLVSIEDKLRNFFGTKVSIERKKGTKGEIVIEYYSDDDLERILEKCE